MMEARDYFGRLIKEGDTVAYPVRKKSDMQMKHLIVRRIIERQRGDKIETYIVGENDAGRRVNLFKLDRCVIVEV